MASAKAESEMMLFPRGSGPQAPDAKSVVQAEAQWETLERQDWHLWMVAMLLMFVLGMSLLSFMFPSVFWFKEEMPVRAPQRAFFGFCVLLALVLVYMLQRQATIRRLKRQLYQAQAVAVAAQRSAVLQSFDSLPGISQFRDSLAMEYLRAARSNGQLTLFLISVSDGSRETLGQVSNTLRQLLRFGEMLFRISDAGFGLIAPGMESRDAAAFRTMLKQRVAANCGEREVSVSSAVFPEEVASLAEFETLMRTHLG